MFCSFFSIDLTLICRQNVFKQCSLLTGVNSNEGLLEMLEYLPELKLQASLFELSEEQLDTGISSMFPSFFPAIQNLIKYQAILKTYLQTKLLILSFQYGMFETLDVGKSKRFFGLQSAIGISS